MKSLEVCLSPSLIGTFDLHGKTTVIIDVFRASTTICAALANGIKEIIPVSKLEHCFSYRKDNPVLCAERGGKIASGFHFGNSPVQFLDGSYAGRNMILTTTNGTKCIALARNSDQIVIGALSNITAMQHYLKRQENDVVLFCAGWKNKVSYEDSYFAGALVQRLATSFNLLNDACYIAQSFFANNSDDLKQRIVQASHYKRLKSNAISDDITFCLQEDSTEVIPQFTKNGVLVGL